MTDTKNWEIPNVCQNCSKEFKIKFGEFKEGNEVSCPHCGITHKIQENAYHEAVKSMREFQKATRNIQKKFFKPFK